MLKTILISTFLTSIFIVEINSQSAFGVCFCVTAGFCNITNNNSSNQNSGGGGIDIRFKPKIQTNGGSISSSNNNFGTTLRVTSPASTGINYVVQNQFSCAQGLERCCPSTGYQCGTRYPPPSGARFPNTNLGQSTYGEYPWVAIIIANGDQFQGSGVLIDHLHVLTAAHKVNQSTQLGVPLNVELGQWDAENEEILPVQSFSVVRVFTHPQYEPSTLRNSIAILRLNFAVNLGQFPTISPVCLPSNVVPQNMRCWIAGWGVTGFGTNTFQPIQKEVDLPLVDQGTCQTLLRRTRLGSSFTLDTNSFMCAGGEVGKDACTGDGGTPLVCSIVNQWYVVGLVAWGIGCGSQDVPGVYINVANYIQWIQQQTRS